MRGQIASPHELSEEVKLSLHFESESHSIADERLISWSSTEVTDFLSLP